MRRIGVIFLLSSLSLAVAAACGSSEGSNFGGGTSSGDGGPGSSSSSTGGIFDPGDSGDNDGSNTVGQPIKIEPLDQTLTVNVGDPAPTIQFVAKIASTGQTIPASWVVDRGELGAINLQTGLFTASTTFGGKAKITASYQGQLAQTSVTIKLKSFQNGSTEPPPDPDAGTGAGGLGGVGGDGPSGNVDEKTITTLHSTPVDDTGLNALYPYDGTVWPRGILPPLLMWNPGAIGHYDAVSIKLTEANFEFEGVYRKNSDNFKNYQIPAQAWKTLTQSNAGEDVDVTITLSKDDKAYGPIKMKWKVASAPLKGIVYYNSYGTKLAQNYEGALPDVPPAGKGKFGGATLAVRGGSTSPVLVAGASGNSDNCRVCHSVAANGSVLLTQRREASERKFSAYDLKQSYPAGETVMTPEGAAASYAWSAIYPDGTMFLNDSSTGAGSTCDGDVTKDCPDEKPGNKLYKIPSGTDPVAADPITTTGWPTGLRAAYPAFSPDGKSVAFSTYQGGGAGTTNRNTLAFMPFDNATKTWGALKPLFTSPDNVPSVFPAFLPTNDAVVFEINVKPTTEYGNTRFGSRGKLAWVHTDTAGTPIAQTLDKLNGTGYIPVGINGHDKDDELNYEPTVNPVPSGGYAWVVFTSRRMYGNVATIDPFWSDPRDHDLTVDPTPKKLWVAAIDLNAPPGSDPSHPAFYLPAQELLAGNSRGYWVVDPCKSDGNGCESGDECCGGYCRPGADQKLVCSNVVPSCAQEFEKCTTSSDCCNNPDYLCINGRCAVPGVK